MLTVVRKQFPEAVWEEFAHMTVSKLNGPQLGIEVILDIERGICVSRAPEEEIQYCGIFRSESEEFTSLQVVRELQ